MVEENVELVMLRVLLCIVMISPSSFSDTTLSNTHSITLIFIGTSVSISAADAGDRCLICLNSQFLHTMTVSIVDAHPSQQLANRGWEERMISTKQTASRVSVDEQKVMRETLRETGEKDEDDEDDREFDDEEEEEGKEVKEQFVIVSELEEEGEVEEEEEPMMNVEYGGGMSLAITIDRPSILSSSLITVTTPLFSTRLFSSVSPLISMYTFCSLVSSVGVS